MKVRIEMEIDLHSGEYDVRFHNLTQPGADVDVGRLPELVHRVLENVAQNHSAEVQPRAPMKKAVVN